MTKSARWPDAALLGVAGSMRTFMPPALLALRGHIGGRGRQAVLVLAAGELVSDKTPLARERIDAPSIGARVASGVLSGQALAGPGGAAAGGASAAVSTFATYRARRLLGKATGLADPWIGAAEDVVAATVAAVATRPGPRNRLGRAVRRARR